MSSGGKKVYIINPNSTIICVQRHRKDTEFLQRLEMQWGAASHHSSVDIQEIEKYYDRIYGLKKKTINIKPQIKERRK